MAMYQAVYDYSSSAAGMLSFRSGDKFTVRNRTNDDWWTVENAKGDMGLVPVSYLDPLVGHDEKDGGGAGGAGGGGGGGGTGVFTALYDFTGQDSSQLSFKKGEKLTPVTKSDVSWWTMRSPAGTTGLVPINYIDVDVAMTTTTSASPSAATSTTTGSQGNPRPHPHDDREEEEALSEVLLSIDRAMQKVHDESILHGGTYTPQQRATLQSLAAHRKSVVEGSTQQATPTNHHPSPNSLSSHTSRSHINATPLPSLTGRSNSQSRGGAGTTGGTSSPRPKRKAPAPPSNHSPQKSSEHFNSLPRKSKGQVTSHDDEYHSQTLPSSRDTSHRDRSRTQPQTSAQALRGWSGSHPAIPPQTAPPQQTHRSTARTTPSPSSSPQRTQQQRRHSENPVHTVQRAASSSTSASSLQVSPGRSTGNRSKSVDIHPPPLSSSSPSSSSSSSPSTRLMPATRTSSAEAATDRNISLPPGLSPKVSPVAERRHASMTSVLEQATPPAPLPTQFPSSDGADLIEVVRTRTHLSYEKSVQAVVGVLELLRDKLPPCAATMEGLLSAVHQSHANTSPSSARKLKSSADMDRLKEIFFQLQDVRDDSQQRGWAVHDDLQAITEYLSELLQILCDADHEVTKAAVREDKYENILTLIGYYDIESRIPIRLLMLQVFGVLCGLDREIISVLLSSILPNELGRDINNHLTEIEKTLFSCTVCTMIFSTGEAIPLTVYDQWSESYVSFLMDTIEAPPDEDTEDQIPDAFLNVILSFNQHFTDPETNLVMKVLKEKTDPRHFSEKFMFLINRGDDPVALQEPLCPDSLTKFALDVFSSRDTSGMFYTTDLMVLIDIVLRQISDLCPGDKIRTHYLELLYRIVSSTDYQSHNHRQREITVVLNRIAQEVGEESREDLDVIKRVWVDYAGCFDEITDL